MGKPVQWVVLPARRRLSSVGNTTWQHNTKVDPMVRALKILVAVLGILLVGGIVALIAMLMTRGTPTTTPRPSAALPHGSAYDVAIDVPAGARIVSAQPDGSRLVVILALPDGRQQILLLDLASGARLGTIELHGGVN
jgi:hypothetical protein